MSVSTPPIRSSRASVGYSGVFNPPGPSWPLQHGPIAHAVAGRSSAARGHTPPQKPANPRAPSAVANPGRHGSITQADRRRDETPPVNSIPRLCGTESFAVT